MIEPAGGRAGGAAIAGAGEPKSPPAGAGAPKAGAAGGAKNK